MREDGPVLSGLTLKVTATLVAVLAATMALTMTLGVNKFETALSSVVESRYQFLGDDRTRTVDASLDLGLEIRDLNSLQSLLDDVRARDSAILAAEIYDEDGSVVFSSDRTNVGQPLPQEWIAADPEDDQGTWRVTGDRSAVIGVALIDNIGSRRGGLLIEYARDAIAGERAAMTDRLLRDGGLLTLTFGCLLMIAVMVLLRQPRRHLAEATRAVRAQLSADGGQPDPAALDPRPPGSRASDPATPAPTGLLSGFAQGTEAARQQLDEARKAVEKLDASG